LIAGRSVTIESKIRVIAAVISRGDEVLVCQRPHTKRHGGLWEFPGGKCEPGESDFAAARRELREELGVHLAGMGAQDFEVQDPDSLFLIAFIPMRIVGEPTCREHLALRWGRLKDLAGLPLAPSDLQYVMFRLTTIGG
jgi:mutator protein MutT